MHQRPHETLIVWQEGYSLCLYTYKVTKSFPNDERFGLVSQMRRSSASVPLNISEGNAKRTPKDRTRFLDIAKASLEELHCLARLSFDLEYLNKDALIGIDDRVNRLSYLLIKTRNSWASS